jgi:hypothetical protein
LSRSYGVREVPVAFIPVRPDPYLEEISTDAE